MIKLETRCHCGEPLVMYEPASWDNWAVHCPRCLDDAEDAPASGRIVGRGATPDDALQSWFDAREEAGAEPPYTLSELATFVVPSAPEGFRCRVGDAIFRFLDTAQAFAETGSPLPIYYTPTPSQKAANQ